MNSLRLLVRQSTSTAFRNRGRQIRSGSPSTEPSVLVPLKYARPGCAIRRKRSNVSVRKLTADIMRGASPFLDAPEVLADSTPSSRRRSHFKRLWKLPRSKRKRSSPLHERVTPSREKAVPVSNNAGGIPDLVITGEHRRRPSFEDGGVCVFLPWCGIPFPRRGPRWGISGPSSGYRRRQSIEKTCPLQRASEEHHSILKMPTDHRSSISTNRRGQPTLRKEPRWSRQLTPDEGKGASSCDDASQPRQASPHRSRRGNAKHGIRLETLSPRQNAPRFREEQRALIAQPTECRISVLDKARAYERTRVLVEDHRELTS